MIGPFYTWGRHMFSFMSMPLVEYTTCNQEAQQQLLQYFEQPRLYIEKRRSPGSIIGELLHIWDCISFNKGLQILVTSLSKSCFAQKHFWPVRWSQLPTRGLLSSASCTQYSKTVLSLQNNFKKDTERAKLI